MLNDVQQRTYKFRSTFPSISDGVDGDEVYVYDKYTNKYYFCKKIEGVWIKFEGVKIGE